MKAKHIITTCGVILGGLAVAGSASATVTYRGSSEVQFTFAPMITLDVGSDGFVIADLMPGTTGKSNGVNATVRTNSSAGYTLSATVGNSSTYNNTDLQSSNNNRFAMMSSGTTLTSGTWGYTLDDGSTYKSLPLYSASSAATLNKTADASNNPADGYSGGATTSMKIGAYANNDQMPGEYKNVVNFVATANMAPHTVSITGGTFNDGSNIGSFNTGDVVTIISTCATDKFGGWTVNPDYYGVIADRTSETTTYTVGNGDVTLNANCAQ